MRGATQPIRSGDVNGGTQRRRRHDRVVGACRALTGLRAATLFRGGLIVAADLPITWGCGDGAGNGPAIAIPPGGATLRDIERETFVKTLALADGNHSRAARILGLHESTLRFRLCKLGLTARPPIS